ncbi:MAG: hypothetical protein HYX61_13140 [Gammaproteobacteria bacterium]|nr:hypothetical protein [Gammaproteobacteria bacterium]
MNNHLINNIKAGSSRPDRDPKKGDPIRDPHKDPGRAIPSPDNITHEPSQKPTQTDKKRNKKSRE